MLLPPSWVDADDKGPSGAYELLDRRPKTGACLDWEAVRRLLDPQKRPGPARYPEDAGSLSSALRDRICRDVAESNTVGGWSLTLYRAGCRYGERGASLDEALTELVAAVKPWNGHETRRAEMHIRNGWQRTAGGAA